jgi:release factor glutamine methyltransferase
MSGEASAEHITWRAMLQRVEEQVRQRNIARWLCEHASGCDADEFSEVLDELVSERSGQQLHDMLHRFASGEPLQYVMGRWAFRQLDLLVDKRVLIPRPETELIVDIVKNHLGAKREAITLVDLGTGSGAIGLSLLHELPLGAATVWMTDESEDALHVARANAAGIGRPAIGARFAHGNWCDALPAELVGVCDVVVSNPPYIAEGDAEVEASVLQWEPGDALFAGVDGLDDIAQIVQTAPKWLAPGGMLVTEMGYTQALAIQQLFSATGFTHVTVHQDLTGRNRFVSGIFG